MRQGKMVEVRNYPRLTLAEIGRYRLDQNGIASEICGGSVDSYLRHFVSAFFAVNLWKKLFGFNRIHKCRDCGKTWPSR